MDTTRAQQQALDDELVAPTDHLKIGKNALKLTPFYNAFEISADVPKIYMQEFWVTVSRHHSSLRFMLNGKSHTVNVDNFRDMLKIFPKLPGQKFEEPPLEEDILSFIRDLGHTGEIKFLSDVSVNHMHQPWRSFAAIINKCLSGKTTSLKSLCLSRAQILLGHTPKPKTTKKKYESEASPKTKTTQATKGKRINSSAKGDKASKKKQPAETSMDKGLTVLSDVALTEVEQLKLVIERSKTQTHSSHASGSGADEGTGDIPKVPDVPTYGSDDEQISCKSSEEDYEDEVNVSVKDDDNGNNDNDDDADNQDDENQDEENQDDDDDDEQTNSDNDDEVNEEGSFDPRVQTPSQVESTDDERNDESNKEVQGTNTKEEKMVEEDEANELYRDVNVNLEGRDTVMSDAPLPNVNSRVLLTGIDLIFNIEATSLVDVPVITIAEPPLMFVTTLPPTPTPLIIHIQKTPFPIPKTAPSTSLQDLPNFGSLFGFDHRLKTLENNFSEFKQTNQFAEAVSPIPCIFDAYLANKMNDATKTTVQLQSDRLRDEAQAENEDFLNKLDYNIKKIIKEQVKEQVKAQVSKILPKIEKTVNEQLEAEVMTRSSTESKTSLAIAANLSELELKKILIEKMESNKLINRCKDDEDKDDEEKMESNNRKDDEDKDEETSAGSTWGYQRKRHPRLLASQLMGPTLNTTTKEQTNEETSQHPDWFQKPAKLPTPNHDWNKSLPAVHGPVQPWLSNLAREEGPLGPTLELMKGTCKSLVELEYLFEEVYKATTEQLDWHNPEGLQYSHDLRKPLPLIPNSHGRQVIPLDHFINNDLACLSGGVSSRTYATSFTKTKAIDYGHIKWIEDLVPNTI
ncbi:hypothetical protein Tco_0885790 [Tanacetum coccineum]